VIATASELFEARHYPSVVAMCTDALEQEPANVELLLMRARARLALRLDLEAQADLREIIRLDATCSLAFRLLGELAARRNEHEPAAVFFRVAVRLDPSDREAQEWLRIVASLYEPRAGEQASSLVVAPADKRSVAVSRGPREHRDPPGPRFARGTQLPSEPEERPTRPFARSARHAARPGASERPGDGPVRAPVPMHPVATLAGPPPTQLPAKEAPRLASQAAARSTKRSRAPIAELPGFDEYLVANGILTPERLRAAQAYQRSMKVQLSTAIVTLGLATPQRIEWAAIAHQSQLGSERS
jgi:tetratricopeptide (TPR) repeat protein